MNRLCNLLTSFGLGAGAMYWWDPDLGNRRRALAQDRFRRAVKNVRCAADKTWRDLENRASGVVAEIRGGVKGSAAGDEVVVDRVRSKMGRYVSHSSSISVESHGGVVTLRGPIIAREVQDLIQAVRSVAGVSRVINELDAHESSEGISALQGGLEPAGEPPEWRQSNWSPTMRLAVSTAAPALFAYLAARQRLWLILLGTAAGTALVAAAAGQEGSAKRSRIRSSNRQEDRAIDEAGEESFPASDPPAFTSSAATPSAESGEEEAEMAGRPHTYDRPIPLKNVRGF